MSFQDSTIPMNDPKPNVTGKTTLNPHAAEFVPFSLRSSTGNTSSVETSPRPAANAALGKAVLNRTESSVSNNSDEEARQYWSRQLPDDITPDFKVSEDEESRETASLLLAGLSFNESGYETSKFVTSVGNQYVMSHRQDLTSPHSNGSSFTGKAKYAMTSYEDDPSSANFLNSGPEPWGVRTASQSPLMAGGMDANRYIGNSTNGFVSTLLSEPVQPDDQINPLEFLAAQFPGFAVESLAEVFYANQCDLNLTIEMLTQLELQVDAGFSQNLTPKTISAPNLSPSDFPALSGHGDHASLHKYNEEMQLNGNGYRSSDKENLLFFKSSPTMPAGGAVDFASAVKKLASQSSRTWKQEKNNSPGSSIGSSRSSQLLASSCNNVQGRTVFGDTVKSHGTARAAPIWLETGEAVGNMYSELREEARDHARVRNVYFEQARQAYLVGNKALAKELSVKGQLYNMRMKAAHGKAQESIYRQRNPVSPEMLLNGRGGAQDRLMIDLHGLHVAEAIHKLKLELGVIRNAARANDQRIPVFICVGTGHHTRGSRTPVRLPVAVQQFLLDEGVDYSEAQPGLLRVVIY
uniref:Smr domain-containing protein n=1 Tax=Kalanchoe fedtschenkoi TaxID=63787 RepID=A0A7N0USD2_KALFE